MLDLARRSGSPSLAAKATEFQPFQSQAVPAPSETRQWPDAKQEIMAKFLQSHSPERAEREPFPVAAATKPVPTVDPVAEIYARLPPIDPAAVADLWTDEVQEDEEEEKPKPVVFVRYKNLNGIES